MKNIRQLSFFVLLVLSGSALSAQTADDIISRYIDAIGGKAALSKMKSLYVEGKIEVMGTEGPIRMTTLNGKGYKQETDIMGSTTVTCITDQGGWIINPMMGSGVPEDMPEAQFLATKNQIYIGAPFMRYAENGFKAELAGKEAVGGTEAVKIKFTAPDNTASVFFFDPGTGYLIQAVSPGEMGETVTKFSDYRKADGYTTAYKIEISVGGGQMIINSVIDKVEVNKPVEASIFNKPE
jgi:hypothetical protein